ncbi:MAG: L-aspartate oxidase [Blastocatellia bacterium]|nr:L-aspartate oxidase [Blastocatellia bacterium]
MKRETDFLVIGSGIAGLRAAIGLSQSGNVVVLTKDKLGESNTEYAQGGVAVALSDDDQINLHFQDTIEAGAGLCDESAVRVLVEQGPQYIKELIEWGTEFDTENGELVFTKEAAHSRRRILHAHGDSTGREIVRSMLARARQAKNIEMLSHATTLSIIVQDERAVGVCYIDSETKQSSRIYARATILATGGAGQLYAHTTNPDVATGDGISMAYLAGAAVCDMEFVQFHPTALNIPNAPRFLISEAVRGEGGRLVNSQGQKFMANYDQREELAPRDIVSRAIVAEMLKTDAPYVYLDLTHLSASFIRQRFPKIFATCLKYNCDITKDLIPVSPAAHYVMGGVRTDTEGRTSLPGLYAAGEVTSTGVHGANRLASNSLLEGLVFGARAAITALNESLNLPEIREAGRELQTENWQINQQVRSEISNLMWLYAGIKRSKDGLEKALTKLNDIASQPINQTTKNMITVAKLIVQAALFRTESRGGHFREDYPQRDDKTWHCHSLQKLGHEISILELA